jgi:hypothetical protein
MMRRQSQATNDIYHMAIVKATYTRSKGGAKAAIRYIEHRPGREGEKVKRELYGADGVMERLQAYQMIDDAEKGTIFFRLVISPDPATEDTEKDLHLAVSITREITHPFSDNYPWSSPGNYPGDFHRTHPWRRRHQFILLTSISCRVAP